jgi:hypothetical protein
LPAHLAADAEQGRGLAENSVGLYQRTIPFTPKSSIQVIPEFAIIPKTRTALPEAKLKTAGAILF